MKVWIAILLLSVSFILGGNEFEEVITKDIKIPDHNTLTVECINGSVNIKTHSNDTIHIRALKSSNDESSLRNTRIIFQNDHKLLKIFSKNKIKELTVNIDYQLTIPQGLENVKVVCFNGKISSKGSFNKILFRAKTNNIIFEGDFSQADFKSTNGKIDIYVPNKLRGNLIAETENGEIRIELNPDSQFNLEGMTKNGEIHSNYDFITKNNIYSKSIRGINKNSPVRIRLKSLNGTIKIYKI